MALVMIGIPFSFYVHTNNPGVPDFFCVVNEYLGHSDLH